MTARVVPKHEIARILDLLHSRGIVPVIECQPGGRVVFRPASANDDHPEPDADREAQEWDAALAE